MTSSKEIILAYSIWITIGGIKFHKSFKQKKESMHSFNLDLGQSDFLLHTCKTCGFKFAPGDEDDTKVHKEFHKSYTHGIQFKGWRNERVIDTHSLEHGRVILVLNEDPPAHIKKVEKVIKMMEMELGDGWIFHKHCKVYLYISSQRVAGCLVAEPINKAYRLVSNSDQKDDVTTTLTEVKKSTPTTLQFGSISLQREIIKNLDDRPRKGVWKRNLSRNHDVVHPKNHNGPINLRLQDEDEEDYEEHEDNDEEEHEVDSVREENIGSISHGMLDLK